MDFLNIQELENIKEELEVEYFGKLEALYVKEVKKVLKWFKDKFPKKHLKWVDGMGTNFWVLDGEIWDCDVYTHAPTYDNKGTYWGPSKYLTERDWTRKEKILKPLVDFYTSINDSTCAPENGVYIGDWSTDNV